MYLLKKHGKPIRRMYFKEMKSFWKDSKGTIR